MIPWDEKWPVLRYGDVFPLPLATETNWTADGWEVNLMLLTDADASGYTAAHPLWSHREPYADPTQGGSREEAKSVHDRAMTALADRLRTLLTSD